MGQPGCPIRVRIGATHLIGVYQERRSMLQMIRVPLIKGGRQTMSDPVLMAQRTAVAAGARRLSAVDGPYWPGAERARPAGTPVHQADPTASARFTSRRAEASGPSPRERDVLTLLADGCSTREIAQRLSYSERTIKNVLQDFNTRLQLRNRTQAVAYAVRRGWI